jgi:hypothetical protein
MAFLNPVESNKVWVSGTAPIQELKKEGCFDAIVHVTPRPCGSPPHVKGGIDFLIFMILFSMLLYPLPLVKRPPHFFVFFLFFGQRFRVVGLQF